MTEIVNGSEEQRSADQMNNDRVTARQLFWGVALNVGILMVAALNSVWRSGEREARLEIISLALALAAIALLRPLIFRRPNSVRWVAVALSLVPIFSVVEISWGLISFFAGRP